MQKDTGEFRRVSLSPVAFRTVFDDTLPEGASVKVCRRVPKVRKVLNGTLPESVSA